MAGGGGGGGGGGGVDTPELTDPLAQRQLGRQRLSRLPRLPGFQAPRHPSSQAPRIPSSRPLPTAEQRREAAKLAGQGPVGEGSGMNELGRV